MIEDLSTASGSMVRRSTVAVVGSGPAGVTLALELANRGVDVLILEGGGLEEDTTQQDLVAAGEIDLNRHAPLTMTHLRQVGGTSNIWGGRSLPFDPWDFEVRSVTGAARWPISYEEIASYIPTACSWLDCGRNVFTARDVPTMPTTMFPGLPDDEVSTSTLERWSLPLSFKQSYLADLKANRRIRLVHGLTCTQIETDGASGRAVALRCRNLVGGEARIEADTFVVAAGGIESTRLLLSSIGPSGSALGDESGHLGRWYQAHVQGVAADIHFARSPGAAIDYVRDIDGSFVRRRFAFTEEFQRAEGLPNIVAWVDNPEVADAEHDCGELSTVYLALKSPLGPMVAGEAQRLSITGTFIPGTPYGGADASPPLDHLRNIARHPVRTARFMAGFGSMRLLSRGRKAPGFMVHNDREVYPFEYHGEQRPNRDSRIWSRSLAVSSSTRTCPLVTLSLTSTLTLSTVPESSLPMLMARVGCRVPLAVTLSVRLPRPTGWVTKAGAAASDLRTCQYHRPSPHITSSSAPAHREVRRYQARPAGSSSRVLMSVALASTGPPAGSAAGTSEVSGTGGTDAAGGVGVMVSGLKPAVFRLRRRRPGCPGSSRRPAP